MKYAAVIFDMDGVLIDSEPFWRQAEMQIFPKVGVHLSEEDCRSTAGLRIHEVVEHWHRKFPWNGISTNQIAGEIIQELIRLIHIQGEVLPGVFQAVDQCQLAGIPIALATSSPVAIMDAVLSRLQIRDRFQATLSAEGMTHAKPHPEIFLKAAESLHVSPLDCLVIEDTVNGIIAAKAARMAVCAVPDKAAFNEPRFSLADYKLSSLSEFHLSNFG